MLTQKNGWGLVPDYLAVFRPEVYELFRPRQLGDGCLDPLDLSRLAVPVTMGFLCAGIAAEVRQAWRHDAIGCWNRAPFHFGAWCMFYISVCGLVAVRMNSMIRYTLPIYVLLILAIANALGERPRRGLAWDVGVVAVVLLAINLVCLQVALIARFQIGHWVA
jgi:hypothetical protein